MSRSTEDVRSTRVDVVVVAGIKPGPAEVPDAGDHVDDLVDDPSNTASTFSAAGDGPRAFSARVRFSAAPPITAGHQSN